MSLSLVEAAAIKSIFMKNSSQHKHQELFEELKVLVPWSVVELNPWMQTETRGTQE